MEFLKFKISLKIIFFILITISINEVNSYKCGSNKLQVNPGILNFTHKKSRRRLDNDNENEEENNNTAPIKIIVDYTSLNKSKNDNFETIQNLIEDTINKIQEILEIEHEEIDLSIIEGASSLIKGRCKLDNIDENFDNFLIENDVIIFPSFKNLSYLGENILVSGEFCLITKDYRVVGGNLYINENITFETIYDELNFKYALFHEFTHILIFHPILLDFLEMTGIEEDEETKYKVVNSEKVLEKAREHFNCDRIEGIRLEDLGGEGIAGFHWDPRYMLGDYMISLDYFDTVISDITLALFEDSGFYKVNYYTGGLFKFGKNKGCDFFEKNCNYTFNETLLFNDTFCFTPGESLCSQSKTNKGKCAIYNYASRNINISTKYQYFDNPQYGGLERMNYCPVPEEPMNDSNIFENNCKFGNISNPNINEKYGNNSFCFIGSLMPETSSEKENINTFCFEVECYNDTKEIIVSINGKKVNCTDDAGEIKVPGYKGNITCPKYTDICSFKNKTICNEMFDCIENHVEADNTYNTIKNRNSSRFFEFNIYFFILIMFIFIFID